jgi:hypothetical protein
MAVARVPEFTPAGVVADARAQILELVDILWGARSDGELLGVVEEVQALRSALVAVEAGAVAEVEVRGVAKTVLHYGSTADWLTHVGGLRRGEGRRVLARAEALTSTMTQTMAALTDGEVSPEQASVIVTVVDALPSDQALRAQGEAVMVEDARSLDATELAKAGRHLIHVIDPDSEDRRLEAQLDRDERAAHVSRFLSIRDDGAGGVWLKGRGSVENGAMLKAALLPLTCPQPGADDTGEVVPDPRDGGTRMWDALVLTAQHALDTDLPPTTHGARPRLALTMRHQDLLEDLGHAVTEDDLELPAGVVRRLACDAEIIPVVLGTTSEILDVGRSRRLVTPAIWQALVVGTATAPSRPAEDHRSCATPTTSTTGSTAEKRRSTISPCYVATTTASSTTHPGKCASTPKTTGPNSNHRQRAQGYRDIYAKGGDSNNEMDPALGSGGHPFVRRKEHPCRAGFRVICWSRACPAQASPRSRS